MGGDNESIGVPAEVTRAVAGVEKAMTKLVKLLADPDEAVQKGVLGRWTGGALPPVGFLALGLATGKDPAYRVRIVEALGTLAPLSRATVLLALADAALDRDPEVPAAAARVVWESGTPPAPKPRPTPAGA